MPNPEGLPGEMPAPRRCTTMHLTGSRRGGLIPESDGTDTSKYPYMGACNQPRCRVIRGDIGANTGFERCIVHDALSYTLEVGQ
jgi:hypothetical protein